MRSESTRRPVITLAALSPPRVYAHPHTHTHVYTYIKSRGDIEARRKSLERGACGCGRYNSYNGGERGTGHCYAGREREQKGRKSYARGPRRIRQERRRTTSSCTRVIYPHCTQIRAQPPLFMLNARADQIYAGSLSLTLYMYNILQAGAFVTFFQSYLSLFPSRVHRRMS